MGCVPGKKPKPVSVIRDQNQSEGSQDQTTSNNKNQLHILLNKIMNEVCVKGDKSTIQSEIQKYKLVANQGQKYEQIFNSLLNESQVQSIQKLNKLNQIRQELVTLNYKIIKEFTVQNKFLKQKSIVCIFYTRSKDMQKIKKILGQTYFKINQNLLKYGIQFYQPVQIQGTMYFAYPKFKKTNQYQKISKFYQQYLFKKNLNTWSKVALISILSNKRHIKKLTSKIKTSFQKNIHQISKNFLFYYYGICQLAYIQELIQYQFEKQVQKQTPPSSKQKQPIQPIPKILNVVNNEQSLGEVKSIEINEKNEQKISINKQNNEHLQNEINLLSKYILYIISIKEKNGKMFVIVNEQLEKIRYLIDLLEIKGIRDSKIQKGTLKVLKANILKQISLQKNRKIQFIQNTDIFREDINQAIKKQLQFLKKIKQVKWIFQNSNIYLEIVQQLQFTFIHKLKQQFQDLAQNTQTIPEDKIKIQKYRKIQQLADQIYTLFPQTSNSKPKQKIIDQIIQQKLQRFSKYGQGRQKWELVKQILYLSIKTSKGYKQVEQFLMNRREGLKKILNVLNEPNISKIDCKYVQSQYAVIKDNEKYYDKYEQLCQQKKKIQTRIREIYGKMIKQLRELNDLQKLNEQQFSKVQKYKQKCQNLANLNILQTAPDFDKIIFQLRNKFKNKQQFVFVQKCTNFLAQVQTNPQKISQDQIKSIKTIFNKKQQLASKTCKQLLNQLTSKYQLLFLNSLLKLQSSLQKPIQQQQIIKNQQICKILASIGLIQQNYIKQYEEYKIKKQQYMKQMEEKIQKLGKELINQYTMNNQRQRQDYYNTLQTNIKIYSQRIIMSKKLNNQFEKKLKNISDNIKRITNSAVQLAKKDNPNQQQLKNLQYCFYNLETLDNVIQSQKIRQKLSIVGNSNIKNILLQKIESINKNLDKQNINSYTQALINLQLMRQKYSYLNHYIQKKIDQLVTQFIKDHKNLGRLVEQLYSTTEGQLLMVNNKKFSEYILIKQNQKRFRYDIDYVIQKIQFDGGDTDRQKLKQKYIKFQTLYKQLVKKNNNSRRDQNLQKLVNQANTKFSKSYTPQNFISNIKQLEQILAYICTVWTLLHINKIMKDTGSEVSQAAMFKPHAAQIIGIFRIFGFQSNYQNNLVQILTGQGKSAILAFCSILFGISGFQVNCACYSEYLSERDYKDFLPLFQIFNLKQNIYYGTFNKICSRILDQNGQIRQLVGDLVTKGDYQIKDQKQKLQKILMIDEVDVFFSQQFYGKYYQPVYGLKDETFLKLADFMWKNKNYQNKISLLQVKSSNQYKNFIEKYPKFQNLIEQQVKQMIHSLQTLQSAPQGYYDKQYDKIGYQQQDRIDFDVSFGFQTLFNYYKLKQLQKLDEKTIQKNALFQISCGKYSYAQIPKKFLYTVGVTGTLKDLNKQTFEVIKNIYKINKFTYVPSVYGQRKLQFHPDQDIYIWKKAQFFGKLRDKIMAQINIGRAVLVFFQDQKKIKQFQTKNKLANMSFYTQTANQHQKQKMLIQATRQKKITLLVKSYGRGTDFICRDKKVIANKGVHVIQTFLSEDISQQTQIKGRTARQGDPGSYQLAIIQEQLEQFNIDFKELDDNLGKKLYTFLDKKRNYKFDQKCRNINKEALDAVIVHQDSLDFYQNLIQKKIELVKQGLLKFNRGPQVQAQVYRTAVILDVTGSMSSTLQNTKSIIDRTMFQLKQILRQAKYNEDAVEIQFVCYRSYNSLYRDQLIYSNWETKSINLSAFLKKQKVGGGDGAEAIQVPLNFIYQQSKTIKIHQILLIGDAPPTPPRQIAIRRKYSPNPQIWLNSKVGNYIEESQKLKSQGIKVNSFYLKGQAKDTFEQIAKITQGKCRYMNASKSNANEDLKKTVVQEVLSTVNPQLIVRYEAKYPKHK